MNIKKCLFCGNLLPDLHTTDKGYYVECDRCGERTQYFNTEDEAIKEWNSYPIIINKENFLKALKNGK